MRIKEALDTFILHKISAEDVLILALYSDLFFSFLYIFITQFHREFFYFSKLDSLILNINGL